MINMNKNKRSITVSMFLSLLLGLVACSKENSPYYAYENKVQSYDGSAMQYILSQPEGTFDSLLVVMDRLPKLKDSLENQQLTFFAPINENFKAAIKYLNIKRQMKGKSALYLKDVNIDQLDTLVCKYFIRGKFSTDAYISSSDGVDVASIAYDYPMHIKYVKMSSSGYQQGGASTLEFSDTFGSSFTKDWVTTKANTVNINTNNATINILDPIHNFGFDEFTTRMDN